MRRLRLRSLGSTLLLLLPICGTSVFATNSALPIPRALAQSSGWGDALGNTIIAGVQFGTPPSSDGRDGNGCTWAPFYNYDNSDTPPPLDPPEVIEGGFNYALWQRTCPWGWEAHWIPDVDRETLSQAASSRMWRMVPSLPTETAPPSDRMVVGVGTWFWVPAHLWQKISITAWIPVTGGVVSATTEAEPRDLIFSPGDGPFGDGDFKCAGPGLRWLPFYGDTKPSSCMYTYRHSSSLSSDDRFHAIITTVWAVSWHSSLGLGGSLPDIETSSALTVRVRELQALTR